MSVNMHLIVCLLTTGEPSGSPSFLYERYRMILRVELENFMGFNKTVDLRDHTVLKGHNGSHKTTILHSIAFALCGTDAWGNAAPVFMISNEMDKMQVIVHTEKSTIKRSLTRKKSSNLRLKVNDIWSTLTQTNMAQFIGPTEHILSVLNPKYFFTLSDAKKKELIVKIFPKVDRLELVKDIMGIPVRELDAPQIVNREPLRAAELFALQRRSIQRDLDQSEAEINLKVGRIQELQEMLKNNTYATSEDEEEFNILDRRKDAYDRACYEYKVNLDAFRAETSRSGARKKELEDKWLQLSQDIKGAESDGKAVGEKLNKAKRAVEEIDAEIENLNQKIINFINEAPRAPSSIALPSGEHCPTCAQPVSKRHRDRITSENAEAKAEYDKILNAHNDEVNRMRAEYGETKARRALIAEQFETITKEYGSASLRYSSISTDLENVEREIRIEKSYTPRQPVEPEKNFCEERREELWKRLETLEPYKDKVAAEGELARAEQALMDLRKNNKGSVEGVAYYFRLEEAMKSIPEKEMLLLEKVLRFGPYRIDTNVKGLVITESGIPYTMMSTGQKMCAEVYLALQINRHLQRKMSTIFLDDAELVDPESYTNLLREIKKDGLQSIRTQVADCEFKVEED